MNSLYSHTYTRALLWVCGLLSIIALTKSVNEAMPSAFFIVCVFSLIGLIVSGMLLWHQNHPDERVSRFCGHGEIALALMLAANACVHVMLSRDLSFARQNVEAAHIEQDRLEKRRNSEADRLAKIAAAQKELNEVEVKANRNLKSEDRRPLTSLAGSAIAKTDQSLVEEVRLPSETPERITEKYSWWMVILSIAECLLATVLGCALGAKLHEVQSQRAAAAAAPLGFVPRRWSAEAQAEVDAGKSPRR